MKAYSIMEKLHEYIDQMKKSELDGFNVEHPTLYNLGGLERMQSAAVYLASTLEREKNRALANMEANIEKMKRLYQLAYGD